MEEKHVGEVTHYFGKARVAAIAIAEGELAVGDTIRIFGHTTDFTQVVESMEIDRNAVERAGAGQAVGVEVKEVARVGDRVLKIVENPAL